MKFTDLFHIFERLYNLYTHTHIYIQSYMSNYINGVIGMISLFAVINDVENSNSEESGKLKMFMPVYYKGGVY